MPITYIRNNTSFIMSDEDPSATTNPSDYNIVWVNEITGEVFVPIKITPNDNLWRGQLGSVRPFLSFLETLDIFGDNSCVFYLPFNGDLNDIGGACNYTFYPVESEQYGAGRWGQALDIIDSSSYLSIHYDGVMDLSFTDNFAYSFNIRGVPERENGSNVFFRSINGTNVPVNLFWLYGDKIKMVTDGVDYVVSSISVDRTEWTNIIVNIDKATNTQSLLFNGVVVAQTFSESITARDSTEQNLHMFDIGYNGNSSLRLAGQYENARLFNRPVTEADISLLQAERKERLDEIVEL